MEWSEKLLQIPEEVSKYCNVYSRMHHDMNVRHNKVFTWLTVFQVILQAYVAVIFLYISQQKEGVSSGLLVSGFIMAILNGICSGIETKFNLKVSTYKHKQYSSAFAKLHRNINMQLVTRNGDIIQFISWASTQYDVLTSESPNIDSGIMNIYALKYPDLNIFYPAFIRNSDNNLQKSPARSRSPIPSRSPIQSGILRTKTEPIKQSLSHLDDEKEKPAEDAPEKKIENSPTTPEDIELGMLMQRFNNQFTSPYPNVVPV